MPVTPEFLIASLPQRGPEAVVPGDVVSVYANIEPLRKELQAVGVPAKDVSLPAAPCGSAADDLVPAAAVEAAVNVLLAARGRKQQADRGE
jgi:hypothetical protein